jgi:hypothetical protein
MSPRPRELYLGRLRRWPNVGLLAGSNQQRLGGEHDGVALRGRRRPSEVDRSG